MSDPVSRDEFTKAIDALRDALSNDRAERLEQMSRFETKFDTRMDAIYQMLAESKERGSNIGARVTTLEAFMMASDKRFADLLSHFDSRLSEHREDQDKEIQSLGAKQDRNWGWVMALIGGVVILMVQSLWQAAHPAPNTPPDVVAPVKK